MANEVLDAVTNELDTADIAYRIDTDRRHLHLRFVINGIEKKQIIPRSASDWRAAKNARSMLRSTLKSMGVCLQPTPTPKEPTSEIKQEVSQVSYPTRHLLLEQTLATVESLKMSVRQCEIENADLKINVADLKVRLALLTDLVPPLQARLKALDEAPPQLPSALTLVAAHNAHPPPRFLRASVARRLAKIH